MKFRDYIKGDRKGKEAHRIENEAMCDPLLNDAIEGYDRTPGDHDAALERLRARIAGRAAESAVHSNAGSASGSRRSSVRNWSIAAAAVLICVMAGTLLLTLKDPLQQSFIALDAPADTLQKPDLAAATEISKDIVKESESETTRQKERKMETAEAKATDHISVVQNNAGVAANALLDSADFADEEVQAAGMQTFEDVVLPAEADAKIQEDNIFEKQSLDEPVKVGFGTQKKESVVDGSIKAAAASATVDTTTTTLFRRYLAGELAKLAADNGPEGSATLEFEVNKQGRPVRITAVESSSPEALREARRILRDGPGWKQSESKKRITIVFHAE